MRVARPQEFSVGNFRNSVNGMAISNYRILFYFFNLKASINAAYKLGLEECIGYQ